MRLGMIGLGRMGANMVRRLQRAGHQCVAFDRNAESVKQVASEGATAATSLDDLVRKLESPRVVWLMVPAAVVDTTLPELAGKLEAEGAHGLFRDRLDGFVHGSRELLVGRARMERSSVSIKRFLSSPWATTVTNPWAK
jgi:NAD(P)-dependent dehydrogenase (short-subunit alcohol dehydrogenase family)